MEQALNPLKFHDKSSLCFCKEDFLKDDFDPDTFVKVQQATEAGSLDELRDDLGIYLKILRSSMIDLINRDYADFVNLSTNLTGLDKLIDALKTPLGQLREEVLSVQRLISDAIDQVNNDLENRHHIRQEKSSFHRLCQISTRLARLEKLVSKAQIESESTTTTADDAVSKEELIDRVASEVNHLNFLVAQCEGAPLLDRFKPRVNSICHFVEGGLEKSLKQGIRGDKDSLLRTLRIYTSLGTIDHAHAQVQLLIREKLDPIIQDEALTSDPRGIKGLYEKTLKVVQDVIGPLLTVQIDNRSDGVGEFQFLQKCAFPEISQLMLSRLVYLFNPGNPAAFHQRYTETLTFLDNFERLIGSRKDIESFRESESYHAFMEQWSLPVYFQIRYQEIGLVVEANLSSDDKGLRLSNSKEGFLLVSSCAVYNGLRKCFQSDLFLITLVHRFWKLVLLILARHRSWVSSMTSDIRQLLTAKSSRSQLQSNEDGVKSDVVEGQLAAIYILHDQDVLEKKLELFYPKVVDPMLPNFELHKKTLIKENIVTQQKKLLALSPPLLEAIQEGLIHTCTAPLKQVSDTPRLYRRTNKPIPTKHQAYVQNAVSPLHEFEENSRNKLSPALIMSVIKEVFCRIASSYKNVIYDVLTSLYKMEESLKRLKRARDRGATPGADSTTSVTDDDKIRLQIHEDAKFLGKQVTSLGLVPEDTEEFRQLMEMVTKARNGEFSP